MKQQLFRFALVLALAAPLLAQEQRIRDASGFSTTAPAGWTVRQDGSGSVAVDPSQTGMIVVKSHSYPNFEAFAADANLARDGFQLVGEVQTLSPTERFFRAAKPTASGYLIADTFLSFAPAGGGSLIVCFTDDQHADDLYQHGLRMTRAVRFEAPDPQVANAWIAALGGKHLIALETGNGYSERTDLYLFGSGEFRYRHDASSLSQNGSGALAGGSDGRWSITPGGELVLQFANGNRQSYQLSARAARNEVGLNGRRFFVTEQ